MRAFILGLFLLGIGFATQAQQLVLNDIKAQKGVRLTPDEVKALVPLSYVVSRTSSGSTRRWKNEADGKFIVSTDNQGYVGTMRGRPTQKRGVWHVSDDGAYCVTIEWSENTEHWCRYLFRVGDKYYGVSSLSNGAAKAWELGFSK